MRTPLATIAALVLVVGAACGDDDPSSAPSTTDETTTTSGGEVTSTTGPSLPGGALEPCESPEGFTISAPTSWSTNQGDVVPECTQFHPEPFEVPEGTDERVAAISAFVDPVAFATAARPVEGRDEDRAVTAVGGRQAVRLAYEESGDGLWPAGTPVVRYLVDLGQRGDQPATLMVDAVGLPGFDHDRDVVVLDRMAATLELANPIQDPGGEVIATYLGGGGGFRVIASLAGQPPEVCLRIPPNGSPVCTDQPTPDQVHTIALEDLRAVQAGVTGERVWRIDLTARDGAVHSYLPVPVPAVDAGAYAFPETVGGFTRIVLRDVTGTELRTVEPGAA